MTTYVYRDGKFVVKGERLRADGLQIVPDIQPYQSMITGERIRSRSHHRDHLKDHGCIEVGNEKMEAPKPVERMNSDQRRRMLHQQLENVTDKQANRWLDQFRGR